MLMAKTSGSGRKTVLAKARWATGALGIAADDVLQIVRQVRTGFPFSRLAEFQRTTAFPWETVARFVAIAPRTLTRRQNQGKLQPDESDRLWRASRIFDLAVNLFEGDADAARQWLLKPQRGLGGEIPLELASTEVGAREVENLIGRLEHGVFS